MFFRRIIAAALLSSIAPLALGGECESNTGDDDSPGQFQWQTRDGHFYGVLEIGEATFTIGGNTITTRAYRQKGGSFSIPGPTLVMVPGEKYVLSFHNLLPYEAKSPEHNDFKDPNISNLHTHGLHISGESPSDDVTRFFEGGRGGDFVYDIPADHMGGTYWYHAHHHGSTFLQVSGGAFGLIIIDDCKDVGVPDNVAAMQEKHLVFGFLDPDVAGTGGDTLISGTLSPSWTVNGKVDSVISMPANEWQHWRTLIADRDARQKALTIGANCEVELLARDGVWRTTAPKALPTNSVTMTGASRADLAVRCTANSTISVDNQVVAGISVGADGDSTPHPYAVGRGPGSTWSVERPNYLRDLRGETQNINTETVSMGARTINGDKFDINVPSLELPADAVQEWTVKGATQHPFHLHIYHMQMMTDCKNYEGGEYYDVIATNCDVRFDLNANGGNPANVYDGRTIMHCHILAHEDQGAMTWMDVIGGEAPPTFPLNEYSTYYELADPGDPPAAPSGLTANAVSSSQIDLAWVDNANDEGGFSIERSSNGTTFELLDSVNADVTTYSDMGLQAATTYDYRVAAFNGNDTSAYSNVASATTLGTDGAALQVDSVAVSTINEGRGQKSGRAVVVISNGQGELVAGATVDGDFSGTFAEPGSGTTDATGAATIDTSGTAKGGISLTFCVTSVTDGPGGLPDFSGEVCGSL